MKDRATINGVEITREQATKALEEMDRSESPLKGGDRVRISKDHYTGDMLVLDNQLQRILRSHYKDNDTYYVCLHNGVLYGTDTPDILYRVS